MTTAATAVRRRSGRMYATAARTTPSSTRSSVESRNAPKPALARHARVAAVEGVADGADDEGDPPQEEVVYADQDAATTHRMNPVSEIALGVRRESMSRSRAKTW